MKNLLTLFRGLTWLKQLGLILTLLVTLYGSFNIYVKVKQNAAVKEYVVKGKQAFNNFITQDSIDVKEIKNDNDGLDRDVRNERLCGGKCPSVPTKPTRLNNSTTMSGRLEEDRARRLRQNISSSDVRDFGEWYFERERQLEIIPNEMSAECTFNQMKQCDIFPSCCIINK